MVFGVPGTGTMGSAAGHFVHNVLARAGDEIESSWRAGGTQSQIASNLSRRIAPLRNELLQEWTRDLQDRYDRVNLEAQELVANSRLAGMLDGLAQFMVKYPPPGRILTELALTNVQTHHEGRLDALFEWDDRWTTVDFKTYSDEAPRSHGYDHLQIVANGMLANYRYGRDEIDFSSNELLVIYTGGIYLPRPTELVIGKVLAARAYVLQCLRPSQGPTFTGQACYTCQRPDACNYYREIERRHRSGQLPETEDEFRRRIWKRRYAVLDFRQISHKNKFIVAINDFETLSKYKILEAGYSLRSQPASGRSILLGRDGGTTSFLPGDLVKIIGIEPGKPLLACANFNGSVVISDNSGIEVVLNANSPLNVRRLLVGLKIVVMRTEIDLTKRELQALDYIQRRAPQEVREIAQVMLGED